MFQNNYKVRMIAILFLSLAGIFGSVYTEIFQSAPCNFCLIIRYSVIAISFISFLSLFWKQLSFLMIVPISVALWADYKIISAEFFSGNYVCEGEICQTPEFLGIRLSIWAIMILSAILFLFVFDTIQKIRDFRSQTLNGGNK